MEANYDAWKEYAYTKGVHAAVVTYLDIKKDDFYKIETTVDGKSFATARGWSDLSEMIKLYEQKGFAVNEQLIGQYLQNKKIAKSFAIYYDLFNKYKSDYQVDKILEGRADKGIAERAGNAKFDEILSLIGLMLDGLVGGIRETFLSESSLTELMGCLKTAKFDFTVDKNFEDSLARQIEAKQKEIAVGKKASNMSVDREYVLLATIETLSEERAAFANKPPKDAAEAFKLGKADFDKRKKSLEKSVTKSSGMLSNVFKFCEEAFDRNGQELLILVTELTINPYATHFISRYGCKEYFEHNKDMLFFERKKEIISEIEELDLD